MEVLRLIYPQWQGGDISAFFKDLDAKDSALGYALGAEILEILTRQISPKLAKDSAIVSVSPDFKADKNGKRIVEKGIIDGAVIKEQNAAALGILNKHKPRKVLTLGGECAVSVPSFCYLANLYKGDLAVVWIDAHPDLGYPHDDFYKGYHAMAVSAIVGANGLKEDFGLPASVEGAKIALVGLNSAEAKHYKKRRKNLGIKAFSAKKMAKNNDRILAWLGESRAKKVAIHLDLDVLNPRILRSAVGVSGALCPKKVSALISEIAVKHDIVGLTIAEHLPATQIKLRNFLSTIMPFIK